VYCFSVSNSTKHKLFAVIKMLNISIINVTVQCRHLMSRKKRVLTKPKNKHSYNTKPNPNQRLYQKLNPFNAKLPNCCCSKGSASYWPNPPFLMFDILGTSGAQHWVPESQKSTMVSYASMTEFKALTGSAMKGLTHTHTDKIKTITKLKPDSGTSFAIQSGYGTGLLHSATASSIHTITMEHLLCDS